MQLDERKSRILKAIVESYITSGEPIGSKALAEMFDNCVSSATIRNDMTVLTSAGYLEQPHTSAGRLPTARAFALYVERLMDKRSLPFQEAQLIDEMLSGASGDATRLLEDTCRALADITGLAAVATRPDEVGSCISRIDVLQMSPRNMAVVLALDNGFLRTRMCRCQRDIPTKFTQALGEYLSRRFLGGPLTAVTVSAMQEILLELGEAGLAVAPLLSAFYELALECINAKTALTGQMNLLRHPDYDIHCARTLTQFLSNRQNVGDLLELAYAREGVQLYLGGDLYPEMTGSTLILTRYSLGKQGQGVMGIIGPQRMDYAAVIPRIEYFATHLGRLMSELFEETEALDFG